MASIGSLEADLGLDTARFESGIKKSQDSIKRFSRNAERSFQDMNRSAGVFAGSLVAIATIGFGAMIKGAIDTADEMSKMNSKLGISTEALSQLKFAGEQSGIEFSVIAKSMEKMTNAVGEANQGMVIYQRAFRDLGLSAVNLAKMNPEDQLLAMADAFGTVTNQTDRTALAMDIFGQRGTAMLQMFEGGSDEIRNLMQEADGLGLTLNNKTAKGAAAANDAINRAKSAMQGAALQASVNLIPIIEDLGNNFSKTLPSAVNNASESFFVFRANSLRVLSFLVAKWGEFSQFVGSITGADEASKTIAANIKKIAELTNKSTDDMDNRQIRAHKARIARMQAETDALVAGDTFGQQMNENAALLKRFADALLVTAVKADAVAESVASVNRGVKEMQANTPTEPAAPFKKMSEGMIEAQAIAQKLGETMKVDVFDKSENLFGQLKNQWAQTLKDMVNAWVSSGIRNLFGSMFASGSSGGMLAGLGGLFGFANGGSFEVGGRGGTDSNLVAFKATRGETVTVNRAGEAGGGGGGVTFHNSYDFSGSTLSESEVRQMIDQSQRITKRQIQNETSRGRF